MNKSIVGTALTKKPSSCWKISCMVEPVCSGAQSRTQRLGLSRVEHLFVSGAHPQVNVGEEDSAGSCDCNHEYANFFKKELAFRANRPKLRIPPRPGSGSSGLYGLRKSFHSSSLQSASSFSGSIFDLGRLGGSGGLQSTDRSR